MKNIFHIRFALVAILLGTSSVALPANEQPTTWQEKAKQALTSTTFKYVAGGATAAAVIVVATVFGRKGYKNYQAKKAVANQENRDLKTPLNDEKSE